jgi:hypothetical protein
LSLFLRADVAQLVEHVLGKDGVSGSIPLIGSRDSVRFETPMESDYDFVRNRIATLFDASLRNPRRRGVVGILPDLKSGAAFKDLAIVLPRLEPFCSGGFYAEGGAPPSLTRSYHALSNDEKQKLNDFYLSMVKDFEASLGKSARNHENS